MKAARARYVAGLDLVRFLCAALVMLYHLGLGSWIGGTLKGVTAYPELVPIAWIGWIGVDVFFVISGLVIAQSSVNRSVGSFLWHRVLRLYPAAWICASLTAALLIILKTDYRTILLRHWATTMLLVPGLRKIDVPYWTLDVEIMFYLVVAGCLYIKRLEIQHLFVVMTGVGSTFNIITTIVYPQIGQRYLWNQLFHLTLLQFSSSFGLGGLMFVCMSHGWTRRRCFLMAYAVVGCLCECYLRAADNIVKLAPSASPWIALLLFLILLGLVLASIRFNETISNLVGGWSRTLGLATYPLYLLHNAVGQEIELLVFRFAGRWWAIALAAAACTTLSCVVVKAERPLKKALERLASAITPPRRATGA